MSNYFPVTKPENCFKVSFSQNYFEVGPARGLYQLLTRETKWESCTQMANLNLGEDVANKIKRKQNSSTKSYPLQQPVEMRRYGSLININPSGAGKNKSGAPETK